MHIFTLFLEREKKWIMAGTKCFHEPKFKFQIKKTNKKKINNEQKCKHADGEEEKAAGIIHLAMFYS